MGAMEAGTLRVLPLGLVARNIQVGVIVIGSCIGKAHVKKVLVEIHRCCVHVGVGAGKWKRQALCLALCLLAAATVPGRFNCLGGGVGKQACGTP